LDLPARDANKRLLTAYVLRDGLDESGRSAAGPRKTMKAVRQCLKVKVIKRIAYGFRDPRLVYDYWRKAS